MLGGLVAVEADLGVGEVVDHHQLVLAREGDDALEERRGRRPAWSGCAGTRGSASSASARCAGSPTSRFATKSVSGASGTWRRSPPAMIDRVLVDRIRGIRAQHDVARARSSPARSARAPPSRRSPRSPRSRDRARRRGGAGTTRRWRRAGSGRRATPSSGGCAGRAPPRRSSRRRAAASAGRGCPCRGRSRPRRRAARRASSCVTSAKHVGRQAAELVEVVADRGHGGSRRSEIARGGRRRRGYGIDSRGARRRKRK